MELASWVMSDTLLRTDDDLLREMRRDLGFNPNPPMDTDGRREDSGMGVRELQPRCSGLEFG